MSTIHEAHSLDARKTKFREDHFHTSFLLTINGKQANASLVSSVLGPPFWKRCPCALNESQ